jgi:hypothetical protein
VGFHGGGFQGFQGFQGDAEIKGLK